MTLNGDEGDPKQRLLTLEELLLERQRLFKLILSFAGMILIVFILGLGTGVVVTYSLVTATCDKVDHFMIENRNSIESRLASIEKKVSATPTPTPTPK